MTREPLRTRPEGEPAGLERVERQNDLARLDAPIARLRRGTHPPASETPLPGGHSLNNPVNLPTRGPRHRRCRICARERRDLCPAHGRAHTTSLLESLCGPHWPLLIRHPHRQETRP